MVRQMR